MKVTNLSMLDRPSRGGLSLDPKQRTGKLSPVLSPPPTGYGCDKLRCCWLKPAPDVLFVAINCDSLIHAKLLICRAAGFFKAWVAGSNPAVLIKKSPACSTTSVRPVRATSFRASLVCRELCPPSKEIASNTRSSEG